MKEFPSKNPLPVKSVATSTILALLLVVASYSFKTQREEAEARETKIRKELEALIATLEKKTEILNSQLKQTTELTAALSSAIEPSQLVQITESLKKPTDEKSYQGRRSNLLKDFVQVTDTFTRPRVYHHSVFVNSKKTCGNRPSSDSSDHCEKCEFLRVAVKSTGELVDECSFKSLMIIQNEQDDPVVFDSVKTLKARLAEEFPIISELKCRMITLKDYKKDFTLTKGQYQALLKTFELSNMPEIKK